MADQLIRFLCVGLVLVAFTAVTALCMPGGARYLVRVVRGLGRHRRLVILWVGIALIALTALCPPWVYRLPANRGGSGGHVGHASLWTPPDVADQYGRSLRHVGVDWSRLVLEWVAVVVLTAGASLTLRRSGGPG